MTVNKPVARQGDGKKTRSTSKPQQDSGGTVSVQTAKDRGRTAELTTTTQTRYSTSKAGQGAWGKHGTTTLTRTGGVCCCRPSPSPCDEQRSAGRSPRRGMSPA